MRRRRPTVPFETDVVVVVESKRATVRHRKGFVAHPSLRMMVPSLDWYADDGSEQLETSGRLRMLLLLLHFVVRRASTARTTKGMVFDERSGGPKRGTWTALLNAATDIVVVVAREGAAVVERGAERTRRVHGALWAVLLWW